MTRFKIYDVYDNHCTELEAERKYTSKVLTLHIGGMQLGSRQWQVKGVYSKSHPKLTTKISQEAKESKSEIIKNNEYERRNKTNQIEQQNTSGKTRDLAKF